ncbi:FixH family protein [Thauera linaloolentis]|uniref:FixH family protein n=1 Tax=Thauera linaloolentis (strain DSM 12138 / JCM 21573 / CCUG 41526 / CIP 105981 / IAM 15112 / NBRC 102519 / 47Lol) TaxID=1123367 RepID=N6YD55_THAL4|nr:FixH family protein [Thauera linaloolentis]ENO89445.1 FixH family protein [Thauera linaloolentis 47Lol = DSM 12138]MCM8566918.1 FixH family protein [Thauera linaloolentis]
MNTTPTDKTQPPWYKQGWPWFLISFPAIAVVAGIITFVIAARTFDGMVVDDYYKEGRAIVQTMGRAEHARELGLKAHLVVRSDSIRIELDALDVTNLPERIFLTVSHPTRDGMDQEVLIEGSGGVYQTALAPLSTGRWLFLLEDESRSWRMNGAAYLPTETEIRIDPSGS